MAETDCLKVLLSSLPIRPGLFWFSIIDVSFIQGQNMAFSMFRPVRGRRYD